MLYNLLYILNSLQSTGLAFCLVGMSQLAPTTISSGPHCQIRSPGFSFSFSLSHKEHHLPTLRCLQKDEMLLHYHDTHTNTQNRPSTGLNINRA